MTLYQTRATTTLSDNTTKNIDFTVPEGKIWIVHYVRMNNGDDVSRNLQVQILDSSGALLHVAQSRTVGAGSSSEMLFYETDAYTGRPLLIKGGNKLRLQWSAGGASSGGSSYYALTYEEIPE